MTEEIIQARFIEPAREFLFGANLVLSEDVRDFILTTTNYPANSASIVFVISKRRKMMDVFVKDFFQLVDMPTDFELLLKIAKRLTQGWLSGTVTRYRGKSVALASRLDLGNGTILYCKRTDFLSFLLPGKIQEKIQFQAYGQGHSAMLTDSTIP